MRVPETTISCASAFCGAAASDGTKTLCWFADFEHEIRAMTATARPMERLLRRIIFLPLSAARVIARLKPSTRQREKSFEKFLEGLRVGTKCPAHGRNGSKADTRLM